MKRIIILIIFVMVVFSIPGLARAEIMLIDNENYAFSLSPYLRLDAITLKNNIDLDSKLSDDTTSYIGLDYSLGFDLKFKDQGPQLYLKLERNGPFDYSAPLFIHNTLNTSTARMENYHRKELWPQLEEFWLDFAYGNLPFRSKVGLFTYEVGHGVSLGGSYENYGLNLYSEQDNSNWHFYYCRPDLVNKSYLGPRITQEEEQGINYEHSNVNFFALDKTLTSESNSLQPYIGFLLDRTDGKRVNNFSTPTHKELLGTLGLAWDINYDKFNLGLEVARNFGEAKSSDQTFTDVKHEGYLIYTRGSYNLDKFSPHLQFVAASGNKVTTEMVDNGDSALASDENRAFSVYSPLNTNLADSVYPSIDTLPLVAMAAGNGLNYGISRPTTFSDPRLLDNIILYCFGFDFQLTEKLALTLDWWYLRSAEKGIGAFDNVAKELSCDLGNEIDLSFNYALTKNITLSLLSGYFFPGDYYKEERDDSLGDNLFTPLIRGDEEADGAYQIELSLTFNF